MIVGFALSSLAVGALSDRMGPAHAADAPARLHPRAVLAALALGRTNCPWRFRWACSR